MVITNAIVCDVDGVKECDVKIEDGVIVELGNTLVDDEIIDAKGSYLIPSLEDKNISLLDATLNAKTIHAIADEAKSGGVGRIIINPNTQPPIDNTIALEYAQNSIKDIDDVAIDLMINTLQDDLSLSNIAILLKKGAAAPYMSTIAKNNIAIKIAEYVKMYDTTLYCKAEDNSLINSGVMLDGDVSSNLGLSGIPELSEVLHVSRMIEIARYFDIKILFKAIASPRSIQLISKAKKEGVRVSCEVSIHHLVRCDESCRDFNTIAKLNPPLASKSDMKELQELLKNGEIDTLTTLHQPNSPVNKEVAFDDAAYGCSALADALPLYYTKLVKSGLIDMQTLLKLTTNSAKIKVGSKANLVLLDTTKSYTVNNSDSLYNSEELFGEVKSI
ncbi:dihydroorotase [Sulfurimonas sp.]|uniref:dihydroorotase n=1 Tax=Sulfurimonas sp. TaxID=2022749 RepID=UPI003D0C6BE2